MKWAGHRLLDWLLFLLALPVSLGMLIMVLGNSTAATPKDIVYVILALTIAITSGLRIVFRRGR